MQHVWFMRSCPASARVVPLRARMLACTMLYMLCACVTPLEMDSVRGYGLVRDFKLYLWRGRESPPLKFKPTSFSCRLRTLNL